MKHTEKYCISKERYRKKRKLYAWLLFEKFGTSIMETILRPDLRISSVNNWCWIKSNIERVRQGKKECLRKPRKKIINTDPVPKIKMFTRKRRTYGDTRTLIERTNTEVA